MGSVKDMHMEMREAEQSQDMIPTIKNIGSVSVPTTFKIGDREVNKATLIAKRDEDVKHVITGVQDTAGYKQAIKLRADYRTLRTSLKKHTDCLAKPHKDYIAGVKKANEELAKEASVGEIYFDEMITAIDNEKERLLKEKEAHEQAKLLERINSIAVYVAMFDGENYTFPYDKSILIPAIGIKSMSDEKWVEVTVDVVGSYTIEQQRISQALLAQQEEETKARLQAEQDESDRLEREALVEQQARANKDKQVQLRLKEITLMGFVESDKDIMGVGKAYVHPKLSPFVSMNTIENSSDEMWDTLMKWHDTEINKVLIQEPKFNEVIWDKNNAITKTFVSGINPYDPTEPIQPVGGTIEKEVRDYSLNDFQSLTEHHYTGTKKNKQVILEAIIDYKRAMDEF